LSLEWGRYVAGMRLDVDLSLDPADYAFAHRIRVRFAETDAMGIVHHSNYPLYLEEARVAYLRALGRPYTEVREDGVDHAVLECFVQYRQPLAFDDEVDVHLVLARTTRASFQISYLLTVGGQLKATAATAHGAVDRSGRPTRLPRWLTDLGTPAPDLPGTSSG
jgi:acyl-CoA thioester hydrolase